MDKHQLHRTDAAGSSKGETRRRRKFNFIGSGLNNTITASAYYSSILSGAGNTNSGSYSIILGGANNTINAGYSYVGVFGNSVPATINNALHLENIWLKPTSYCSFPGFPSTFVPGTIYIDTTLGAGKPLRMA